MIYELFKDSILQEQANTDNYMRVKRARNTVCLFHLMLGAGSVTDPVHNPSASRSPLSL